MTKISKKIARYGFFIKFFIILILSFLILLKYGIKIDALDLGGVNLQRLYIKLDKKLIVRAQKIKLPRPSAAPNEKNSGEYLLGLSKKALWIDRLFSEIELKSVRLGDSEYKILFKDNVFFVDSPNFAVDLEFANQTSENTDEIIIKGLEFKDFNVSIKGAGSANFKAQKYAFKGEISSYELTGGVEVEMLKERVFYKAKNVRAGSLKNFMDALARKTGLDSEIKNWIYGYIIAQDYEISELNGKIDLAKSEFFLNDLNASGSAKNLKVKFHPKLPAADVESANIALKDGNLSFELVKPSYKGKTLEGSNLTIYEMFGERAGLTLNLKSKSNYDGAINDILKAYDIVVPVTQTGGKTDGALRLDIDFSSGEVLAKGKFVTGEPRLNISGAKFSAKSAEVDLINSDLLKIDARGFGMDFFNADLKGAIDINKSAGEFAGVLKNLDLSAGAAKILEIKDEPVSAKLDFSGAQTKIDVQNLGVFLTLGAQNEIYAPAANELLKFSPLLKQIGVNQISFVSVKTSDFKDFEIDAAGGKFSLPFVKKDGSPYESDDFKILVKGGEVSGRTASKALNFDVKNGAVNIYTSGLDLVSETNSTSKSEQNFALNLYANDAKLILSDLNRTLPFERFEVAKNGDALALNGFPKQGRLGLAIKPLKDGKSLELDATDVTGEFINSIFNIQSFEGGHFRLKLLGKTSDFKGEARFYGAYLKDYVFYQRFLSFLNSIPSLLTLKTPDFNDKGFTIKNGKILFEKTGEKVKFLAIDIEGSSADIGGHGQIDLKSGAINVDLELKILKDASGIIDKIPLVNQIILGKDRSLSTVISVRGTLEKPEYSTQVLTDALLSPFKVIRNVLQAPFLIFE